MKKLFYIFTALAILLSDIMCAVVAYIYRDILCLIKHSAYAAPASIAFLYIIPFAIAIAICVVLAIIFYKKSK